MLKKVTAALLMSTAASTSMAAMSEDMNPWTDCGLGAMIFKNDTAAAISNVIWDLGTTAVTSATLSPETCGGLETETAAFIMESYDSLVQETAQGSGAHLDALMNMVSLDASQQEQVKAELRTHMASEVTGVAYLSQTEAEKAQSYYFALVESVNKV